MKSVQTGNLDTGIGDLCIAMRVPMLLVSIPGKLAENPAIHDGSSAMSLEKPPFRFA